MARKSRKNMMLQENTALPDKEKKVLFKAGLYARLSHEKEENIERGTIETQMELMKNYVKDHEDIVIEEEYYDASFTGTNFERPDFKRMLEDAKTGRINCIIVKDLSRLGRNYVEMGNYIERVFPFLNVRFIAVTDDFDSFRPGTDLMMPLKNIVNEFYAKDISKKVSTAHRRKWTTDEYMCGFAPYGYLKSKTEKNRIVVDEATAGNVRLIYKLFLDGKGYTPIAKYLNEQGIMSPLMYLKSLGYQQNVRTNGVWTKTTVKSILTNQAYIGSAVHGKVVIEKYNNIPLHATDPSEWVVVENTHEPLIDKKTFEKVQERVKEISDAYFAKEFTKHPPNEMNLLKGKIVCGDCGKGMRLSPRTTKSYVYFCGTFSDGINPACSRHKIDQEEVNKAVFAQISNHMRCCIDALKVIRELNARSSGLKKYDVYEKAITRQRRELEKVNRKFSELYGDYSEHLINESEYLTLKQQYLLKSEALKKEIDNLLVSQNLYSKNYKIDEDWENLINKYLKCRKLNKELADAFVDKVQVFEDGRISVNLVYDDCLEELLQVKNKREGDLYE
ncbi:site-specific recombinase [Agathobacter rectalis]|jgi:site-specific DNA recombinase|uniref:Site-specific recombinase n=1 Tax=Agathobacter rectalis TaxID=39491 RepID=A0A414IU10_9FIRM|nr:recombinase family protein [Agathobacter rectalis]RGT11787.1 site-specific recombinase [Agathobacter rectalis]RGT18436.1 site-specific recombinase [Agathobacter rectalis]RHE32185.1 site-specific recombinase [Agathobacter rectalis]